MAKKKTTGPKDARVTYNLGATLNIDQFENVKIEVGVTLPCHEDEVEDRMGEAATLVEEFIQAETQGGLDGVIRAISSTPVKQRRSKAQRSK